MTSKPDASRLPPEAMAFAKKMGFDLKGLEPEAEDLWKMLENMSNQDPLAYNDFIRAQFEEAKNENENKDVSKKDTGKRSFRPTGKNEILTCSCLDDLY